MRNSFCKTIFLFIFAMIATRFASADSMFAGRHKFISAVPAPGKVTIDGKLDDWDLSGEILSYDYAEVAAKRNARTALMYDKDNLYVSVRVTDPTPLINFNDAKVDKSRGWSGDAFQMRIAADSALGYPIAPPGNQKDDSINHITMWYFTGRGEPQMNIERGMDFHDSTIYLGADSGLAFQKTEDGYILEGKIPWARLKVPGPPAPGTKLPLTLEYLFGDDEGLKAKAFFNDVTASATFSYQTASLWGYVLFEPTGHLQRPREELPKPSEVAKTLTFTYTLPQESYVSIGILNDKGDLVRTLLAMDKRPAGTNTERWDGLDDYGNVLPAGKYSFKALRRGPVQQDWVVSVHNSGNPPWVTADGKGSWGGDHGAPEDVGASGDKVFMLWQVAEAGSALIGCTLDGQKQWGANPYQNFGPYSYSLATDGKLVYVAQTHGVTAHDATTGRPVNFAGDQRGIAIEDPTDLAYREGHLFVLAKGKIHDIQLDEGKVVRTFVVDDKAHGLAAVLTAPYLLTATTDGVWRVDLKSGAVQKLFGAQLVDPADLTLSQDDKQIYVSDSGRSENEVKVFSYPDGKPLGTVGKPGGRPAIGKFNQNGLFHPKGLSFDSQGRLWVAECDYTPKRISVWQPDGKHGKFLKEYFGASAYSVGISADPAHPEYVYLHNTRWIVDYDMRTAKIDCTIARPGWNGPQPVFPAEAHSWMGDIVHVRHARGRTFLYDGTSVWEMLKDHAVPIFASAALGSLTGSSWPIKPLPGKPIGYWSDTNRDGIMQTGEIELAGEPWFRTYWQDNMGNDLAMEHASGRNVYRVPVNEWRNGIPVWYHDDEVKPIFQAQQNVQMSRWSPSLQYCYVLEADETNFQVSAGRQGISRYTRDGKRLWQFKAGLGMDISAPLTKPGQVRGAQNFIGLIDSGADRAGELIAVNGYYGNFNLLNEDGLFVAELSHDNRRGGPLDATVVNPEGFGGFLVQHPKTKKIYLMAGDSDGRIWEIKGLDTLRRFTGAFDISDNDVKNAAQALADFQKQSGTASTTTIARAPKPVAVDGSLDEWNPDDAVNIPAGQGRGGKVLASYDDTNLYLAYRVADDSPFVNAGGDFPLLFKTGDAVDMMLNTDVNADAKREKSGAGDLRLLFAPLNGKPVAVVYQKVAAGGPAAPFKFTSPTGTEDYERVAIVENAQVAVKREADGYVLEAAVPLSSIGWLPASGKEYSIDFGVLYSDAGGARTVLRSYWANKNTSITGDIPTESRIEPKYLGRVVVK